MRAISSSDRESKWLALKRRVEGEYMEKIFAHPAFHQAMEDALTKLHTGTAQWHSYDEVFGD